MKNKKLTLLVTAVVLTASFFSGCGGSKQASTGKNGKLQVIKTWSRTDCTAAPVIVADKLGYFKDQGLKVEYTGDTQPAQRLPSILNGNNDFGDAHPNNLAIAAQGGAKLKAVARSIVEPPESVTDTHLQHMWWISNKNGPIKTLADINKYPGKVKVGTNSRNSCVDYLSDILFAKNNISLDKIEWVQMPDIEQVLALKKQLIQIAVVHPPYYKSIEDSKIGNILTTSRPIDGENGGTYLYYFSDKFIKQHPDEVAKFVVAIKKAERYINKSIPDPKERAKVNQWTADAIGVPVSANHYYADNGTIKDSDIKEWIDGSIKSGALPKNSKVKVSDIVTHDFDKYANLGSQPNYIAK
ncbi:ABC transporter substrate-binding protein [Clostridium coskatii]|uniref:NMT1/THI5 like protein n=1 Tax=Clostridium coskatii TaxID=1705578 RepID=A0A162JDY1_9CLOT|nr:ABC transporter substrate-binding protein [Clostridium coskatii]OAA93845.1 NMT1/THI5 like protein [Clostridium coskatii]OBR95173.1 NMT1/THI5 like protein [Clostridium coskatii]